MGRFIDLTGQKFGSVKVISRAPNKGSHTMWYCKCDCGKEFICDSYNLRSGQTKTCGCKINRSTDLTGQHFGKFTAVKLIKKPSNDSSYITRRYWECKCDCGATTIVREDELKNGNTQSCGCLKSKGELKINNMLQNKHINFSTQYTFNDLKSCNNVSLKFDFAIFKDNLLICLIEYDGEQHFYTAPHKGFYTEDVIKQIIQRDHLKDDYCLNHNIKLYRIPYYYTDEEISKVLDGIIELFNLEEKNGV